jgi:hypothetical protein
LTTWYCQFYKEYSRSIFAGRPEVFAVFFKIVLGRGHTKETDNCNATEISEDSRRFQAGNWFPD